METNELLTDALFYVRVCSDEELMVAIAMFISKGFDLEVNEIYIGGGWETPENDEVNTCVAAYGDGKICCNYVSSVIIDSKNPIEIFLPRPADLFEEYASGVTNILKKEN